MSSTSGSLYSFKLVRKNSITFPCNERRDIQVTRFKWRTCLTSDRVGSHMSSFSYRPRQSQATSQKPLVTSYQSPPVPSPREGICPSQSLPVFKGPIYIQSPLYRKHAFPFVYLRPILSSISRLTHPHSVRIS